MPRYNLTALRFYIDALASSVPLPVRYSQARTYSTIITTIQMKEDIEKTSDSSKETRSVFIGAKVTPTQKEHIWNFILEYNYTYVRTSLYVCIITFFFGGANKDKIKKAIFPDSQSFVNLKSNTMKNTVQIYEFLRWVQILRKKKSLL